MSEFFGRFKKEARAPESYNDQLLAKIAEIEAQINNVLYQLVPEEDRGAMQVLHSALIDLRSTNSETDKESYQEASRNAYANMSPLGQSKLEYFAQLHVEQAALEARLE